MKVMLDDVAYMPERAHEADERTRGARRRLASGLVEEFHVGKQHRSCLSADGGEGEEAWSLKSLPQGL